MIKHLVFFRMKDEARGQRGEDNAWHLVQQLLALKDEIPELVSLEAGTNFTDAPTAFDVGLYTAFNSKEDLEAYRVHPAHQKVVEFITETTDERALVDFED